MPKALEDQPTDSGKGTNSHQSGGKRNFKEAFKDHLGQIFVCYLIAGLIFAVIFAKFYHWPALGFFSPGFYFVILTWPFQLVGFLNDFFYYGISGPPL